MAIFFQEIFWAFNLYLRDLEHLEDGWLTMREFLSNLHKRSAPYPVAEKKKNLIDLSKCQMFLKYIHGNTGSQLLDDIYHFCVEYC